MSQASSESGTVAAIVGRWKDTHNQKHEAQQTREQVVGMARTEGLLRIPETVKAFGSRSHPDGNAVNPALLQQCAEAVAWLAQVITEDRKHVQSQMDKIINLMERQERERDLESHGLSHGDITRALTANADKINSAMNEEFQKNQVWMSQKFHKLALLVQKTDRDMTAAELDILHQIKGHKTGTAAQNQTSPKIDQQTSQRSMPVAEIGGKSVDWIPELSASRHLSLERCAEIEKASTTQSLELQNVSSEEIVSKAREPAVVPAEDPADILTRQPTPTLEDQQTFQSVRSIHNERNKMAHHVKRMKNMSKRDRLSHKIFTYVGIKEHGWQQLYIKPQNCLQRFAESRYFTQVSILAIISNGVWIGYQTNVQMEDLMHPDRGLDHDWHKWVSRSFSLIFAIELIIRLLAYRLYFWVCDDKKWNYYDVVVVLGAVSEEAFDSMNLNFLRTLRVLRLARVTRVIRVLRFFQGLRYLLITLARGFLMLTWAILFLGLLIYVFAILFMQGVNMWIDETDTSLMARVNEYYGSLPETMFTLMMVVTGGQPWEIFLKPLQEVNEIMIVPFVIYVTICSYGILNIVSAVFLELLREIKERDKDLAVQREIGNFDAFLDELKTFIESQGYRLVDELDWPAFQQLLSKEDVQMYLLTHNIDVGDAEDLFLILDSDRTAHISVEAFIFGCQRIKGGAKGLDIVLLSDQVSQIRSRLTTMSDKQNVLHRELFTMTDKIREEFLKAMSVMNGIQIDFETCLRQYRTTFTTVAANSSSNFSGLQLSMMDEESTLL